MTGRNQTWRNRIKRYGEEAPDQLLAHPLNWRLHGKDQQAAISGVLDSVGVVQNIIVNERTGHVIDGHLRITLAMRQGQPTVPVTYVDLDESEEALILATLDPIGALAGQDDANLAELLALIDTDNADVQALLDSLATGVETIEGGLTDPDDVPGVPSDPVTNPGDLWLLGRHRLLCGDATVTTDVERLMGGERARCVVTSPPYNQNIDTFKPSGMQRESPAFVHRMASAYDDSRPEPEYQDEQVQLLELLKTFMTDDGSIFYNHKIRYRDKCIVSPLEWLNRLSFPIRQEIIWDRASSITLNARMLMPADERIYWLRVGDDFLFNDEVEIKSWSTVWQIAAHNDVSVSAAFATEIPRRCIRMASNPGDIVLDPYSGSGTTIIAAEEQGRIGYGMEVNPAYVDVTVQRWEQFTGQTAVLATDRAMAAA